MVSRYPVRCGLILGLIWMGISANPDRSWSAVPIPKTPESAEEAGPPQVPSASLARMPGFEDEVGYAQSVADHVSELVASADQQGSPIEQVGLRLAAANLILARQLEPACSRKLLGMDDDQNIGSRAILGRLLDQAESLLTKAGSSLGEIENRDALAEGWFDESRDQVATLRAFAQGLRAFLFPGSGPDAKREVRAAASRLSPILEHGDPAAVAAATFWQATLRSDGNPERVLSMLDLALTNPQRGTMPYAFFSRILRCRLIAEGGSPQTSLALLMQVEERCHDWFSSDVERAAAIRAAQLVQIQVLSGWYDQLTSAEVTASRKWCASRTRALIGGAFAKGDEAVVRLTPAIPILAHPPEADSGSLDHAPEGN